MYEKIFSILLLGLIGIIYYFKFFKKTFKCNHCKKDSNCRTDHNIFHCHACMTKETYCNKCNEHNTNNIVPICQSCEDLYKNIKVPMSKEDNLSEFNLEINNIGDKGIFQTARLSSKEAAIENLRLLIAANSNYNAVIDLEVVVMDKLYQARGMPVKYLD